MAALDPKTKLPQFGIRDLHGPRTRPGIVQISAPQYDETIKSQPDAALIYLDDDDGEEITVGSSFELRQRLDDPVSHHVVNDWPSPTLSRKTSFHDQKMHIFDIQKTSGSLAVWREHEAYSSKTLSNSNERPVADENTIAATSTQSNVRLTRGLPDGNRINLDGTVSIGVSDLVSNLGAPKEQSHGFNPPHTVPIFDETATSFGKVLNRASDCSGLKGGASVGNSGNVRALGSTESNVIQPSLSRDEIAAGFGNILNEAVDGLGEHLGGFANFLDKTAEVLRKMAEKTREADTSPVETILDGFKNILTEVGEFGIDVLRNLDAELPTTLAVAQPAGEAQKRIESSAVESNPQPESRASEEGRIARKRVSFADLKQERVDVEVVEMTEKQVKKAQIQDAAAAVRAYREVSQRHAASAAKIVKPRYPSVTPMPVMQARPIPSTADFEALPAGPAREQEGERDSFGFLVPSREHSNRRCVSTYTPNSTKKDRAFLDGVQADTASASDLQASKSIMDLETSDPDFSARYPPLMSLRRAKTVGTLNRRSRSRSPGPHHTNARSALSRYPSIGQFEEQDRSARTLRASALPSFSERKTNSSTNDNNDGMRPSPYVSMALPGAWPEPRGEESEPLLPVKVDPPKEAPEKFGSEDFYRSHQPGLSCRSTSPLHDPFVPNTSLRRSQTVTASNPAARLTRPFDPLSSIPRPVLTPAQKLSQSRSISDNKHTSATNQLDASEPGLHRSRTVHTDRYRPKLQLQTPATQSTLYENFERAIHSAPWRQPPPPTFVPQAPVLANQTSESKPLAPATHKPGFADDLVRRMHSVPNIARQATITQRYGPAGVTPQPTAISSVDECIKTLKGMGYGAKDSNEMSRLFVYAGAAAGDVVDAVEMIEEDRKAAVELAEQTAAFAATIAKFGSDGARRRSWSDSD